jgi:hypothetical protein
MSWDRDRERGDEQQFARDLWAAGIAVPERDVAAAFDRFDAAVRAQSAAR